MKRLLLSLLLVVILAARGAPKPTQTLLATATLKPSRTPTPTGVAVTATPSPTVTDTVVPSVTPTPSATFTPWPGAPLCPDHGDEHEFTVWHSLWDSTRGCHYDHEHGENPFTPAVAAAFPGMDLYALLGGVQIGHTNLSSPLENTAKHGGMKWYVDVPVAHPGATGFEGNTVGVCNLVTQAHNFGDYGIEFETRLHTAVALVDQCQANGDGSFDHGYLYTVQLMEYGQRTRPYQGVVLDYPDNFVPAYTSGFGPYFTADCVGAATGCRPNLAFFLTPGRNAASKWTSKPTGSGARPPTSTLLQILFDIRDIYRVLDSADNVYPFTWLWICSSDGGVTFNPVGCRFNNSTSDLHEIAGTLPASWDNLAGWDSDPRVGRITAEGYVTRYGVFQPGCTAPGPDCYPFKALSAFVGKWGADLCVVKCSLLTPANTVDHDLYFDQAGQVVPETAVNTTPAGWIGPAN